MINNRYFSNIAYQSTQRALNLMDRNSYSKTFGCFDRYYWHFKTKDFPSASYQMGVEFLARLWADSHKDNSFYKNQRILNWLKAGFEYTCSIQNKDGSFDEWYPNERGWAGPVSYIIHSLANAYKLTEKELEEDLKNKLKICFYKAFCSLIKQKEGAYLANHSTLFLLSLYDIFKITREPSVEKQFKAFLPEFKKLINEEGWSKEYDGVDFGYNLATLSFLASLYKQRPEPFLKQYAEKSFSFLSYFFYPEGSFGGLGSRETVHLYPYAFKFWGGVENLPLAKNIYFHLVHSKSFENLRPFDQDDHYLFYRLNEYLSADEIILNRPSGNKIYQAEETSQTTEQTENLQISNQAGDIKSTESRSNDNISENSALPCFKAQPFEKFFEQAGFFIKKTNFFYLVVNLKRGAAFYICDLSKPYKIYKNKGWVLKTKRGTLITNFWSSKNKIIQADTDSVKMPKNSLQPSQTNIIISGSQAVIKGPAFLIHQRHFKPFTFILFRLSSFFAFHYKLAFLLKRLVRSLLILKKKKAKCFFKRVIQFDSEKVSIEDIIESKESGSVFYGADFTVRYVPQADYFEKSDLYNTSSVFPIENKLHIFQNYNFKENTVKTFKK